MTIRHEMSFVETSVFRVIENAKRRTDRSGWNALVVGAAGVGKTRAIAEIVARAEAEDLGSVRSIEVTSALGLATFELLRDIADIVGVSTLSSLAAQERRLKEARWYHVRTLIFDEAQNLQLKTARTLLSISEATGHRMIFVGNPEVLKLVGSAQAAIQQISRRLPIRETIEAIDDADADLIASTFGCEGMDAFRAVREIGRTAHVDGIVKVLHEARVFAEMAGAKTITARDVASALDVFPQFRNASVAKAKRRRA